MTPLSLSPAYLPAEKEEAKDERINSVSLASLFRLVSQIQPLAHVVLSLRRPGRLRAVA